MASSILSGVNHHLGQSLTETQADLRAVARKIASCEAALEGRAVYLGITDPVTLLDQLKTLQRKDHQLRDVLLILLRASDLRAPNPTPAFPAALPPPPAPVAARALLASHSALAPNPVNRRSSTHAETFARRERARAAAAAAAVVAASAAGTTEAAAPDAPRCSASARPQLPTPAPAPAPAPPHTVAAAAAAAPAATPSPAPVWLPAPPPMPSIGKSVSLHEALGLASPAGGGKVEGGASSAPSYHHGRHALYRTTVSHITAAPLAPEAQNTTAGGGGGGMLASGGAGDVGPGGAEDRSSGGVGAAAVSPEVARKVGGASGASSSSQSGGGGRRLRGAAPFEGIRRRRPVVKETDPMGGGRSVGDVAEHASALPSKSAAEGSPGRRPAKRQSPGREGARRGTGDGTTASLAPESFVRATAARVETEHGDTAAPGEDGRVLSGMKGRSAKTVAAAGSKASTKIAGDLAGLTVKREIMDTLDSSNPVTVPDPGRFASTAARRACLEHAIHHDSIDTLGAATPPIAPAASPSAATVTAPPAAANEQSPAGAASAGPSGKVDGTAATSHDQAESATSPDGARSAGVGEAAAPGGASSTAPSGDDNGLEAPPSDGRPARKRRKSAEAGGWRSRYNTEEFESGEALLTDEGSEGGTESDGNEVDVAGDDGKVGVEGEEDDEWPEAVVEVGADGDDDVAPEGELGSGGGGGGGGSSSGAEGGGRKRRGGKKRDSANAWKRRCANTACGLGASFGNEGQQAMYCSTHKEAGMVNVTHRRCEEQGCPHQPSFNQEGMKALYCRTHKRDGMINVCSPRCNTRGCMVRPSFGFEWDVRASFCDAHKQTGMINIRKRTYSVSRRRQLAPRSAEGSDNGSRSPSNGDAAGVNPQSFGPSFLQDHPSATAPMAATVPAPVIGGFGDSDVGGDGSRGDSADSGDLRKAGGGRGGSFLKTVSLVADGLAVSETAG